MWETITIEPSKLQVSIDLYINIDQYPKLVRRRRLNIISTYEGEQPLSELFCCQHTVLNAGLLLFGVRIETPINQ